MQKEKQTGIYPILLQTLSKKNHNSQAVLWRNVSSDCGKSIMTYIRLSTKLANLPVRTEFIRADNFQT